MILKLGLFLLSHRKCSWNSFTMKIWIQVTNGFLLYNLFVFCTTGSSHSENFLPGQGNKYTLTNNSTQTHWGKKDLLKNRIAWTQLVLESGLQEIPMQDPSSNSFKNSSTRKSSLLKTYFHKNKDQFPRWGSPQAKVTVFEFSDFTCGYCKRFHSVSKEIREKYKEKVEWIFVDYPLEEPPFESSPAHLLSVCIHTNPKLKNQFWKFYDSAFAANRIYDPHEVEKLAKELGISQVEWEKCFLNENQREFAIRQIKANQMEGSQLGLKGTPSFLIGSQRVVGYINQEKFENILKKQLLLLDK